MISGYLKENAPRLYRFAHGIKQSLRERAYNREIAPILRHIAPDGTPTVHHGPFAAMRYVQQSVCGVLGPKLVGSYEHELHGVIQSVVSKGYERVIDVGCAEGYYAVGLARLMPETAVYAFDANKRAIQLCRDLARANGVADRVNLRGRCRQEELRACLIPGSFVLMDCEGAEAELLDPAAIPALADCDLLVELHDFIRPGISKEVTGRFLSTHLVTMLPTEPRDPSRYGCLQGLPAELRALAVNEFRPGPMQWAYMVAREDRV